MKALEEKEAKVKVEILRLEKGERKNIPNTDLNENDIEKEKLLNIPEQNPTEPSSTFPSNKAGINTNPSTIYTSLYTADITTYPSMAVHWIAPGPAEPNLIDEK